MTLDLPEVEVWEVPEFASEREEADFWASHGLGQSSLDQDIEDTSGIPRLPRSVSATSIRLDRATLWRLKRLAARRGKGYQTLLKEFVIERLYEEEKREGIIPPRPPGTP